MSCNYETLSPLHTSEIDRLRFVLNRDGLEGAIRFAKQTIYVYRASLKQRNKFGKRAGYGLAYRKELVASCVVARRFLRDNSYITELEDSTRFYLDRTDDRRGDHRHSYCHNSSDV